MEFSLTLKRTRDTVRALTKPGAQLGIGAVRHRSPRVESNVENAPHETILSGVGIGLSSLESRRAGDPVGDRMPLSPSLGGRAKALPVSERNGKSSQHEVAQVPTIRTRGSKAWLVGAAALLAASSACFPAPARGDTVVLQESNGFPGSSESENARQKVLISDDKLKVLDDAHGWALFVRLDKKSVAEVWASEKGFVEKPLSSFAEIRAKREKTRAEKVDEFKKLYDRAKDDSERANLKRKLEQMGLKADGSTTARFEAFPDDKKKVTLVLDDKQQEIELTHFIVRENEGPPVFDIWAAPSIAQPANIFKFYQEIGTFSPQVVKALTDNLKAFPIEITAVLDDGNNQKTLHSKVYEIRTTEKVDPISYDVPAGFKPLKEEPKEGPAPAAKLLCTICGKECTPGQGEASFFTDPWTNKRYPVCSEDHRREVIRRLAAEQRKK